MKYLSLIVLASILSQFSQAQQTLFINDPQANFKQAVQNIIKKDISAWHILFSKS